MAYSCQSVVHFPTTMTFRIRSNNYLLALYAAMDTLVCKLVLIRQYNKEGGKEYLEGVIFKLICIIA